MKNKKIFAYTWYPFSEEEKKNPKMRKVRVIAWDTDKYVTIKTKDMGIKQLKRTYVRLRLHTEEGFHDVPGLTSKVLSRFESFYTRKKNKSRRGFHHLRKGSFCDHLQWKMREPWPNAGYYVTKLSAHDFDKTDCDCDLGIRFLIKSLKRFGKGPFSRK